jgi:hypothetical protein
LKKTVARTPTGIPGLDEILGGGFPQGRVVLVLGEPGAGKTILCSQYLANGIAKFGENGLFVSMEEGKGHYWREMSAFGWELEGAEKTGKFNFVDASPIRTIPGEVRIGKLTIGRQDFSLISGRTGNFWRRCAGGWTSWIVFAVPAGLPSTPLRRGRPNG